MPDLPPESHLQCMRQQHEVHCLQGKWASGEVTKVAGVTSFAPALTHYLCISHSPQLLVTDERCLIV